MDLGKITLLMTMIDLVDKISSNIDNKYHNIGIYFVFISERLFDTKDHNILLQNCSAMV